MRLDQRIDIDLRHLRTLLHNTRERRNVLSKQVFIQCRLSTESANQANHPRSPIDQPCVLQVPQRELRLLHAHRTHVEHHVLQHLHHHASEARHGDRAERGVAVRADHHLQPLGHHLAHHDAVVLHVLLAELRVHRIHRLLHRLGVLQVQRHAAHIGLVDDLRITKRPRPHVRRHHLGHELLVSLLQLLGHEVRRVAALREQLIGRRLDAAQSEHVVPLHLRESLSALVQHLVEQPVDALDVHLRERLHRTPISSLLPL